MKLAELLAAKEQSGEVKPAELPVAVVVGVKRYYAEHDRAAERYAVFQWAEAEVAKVRP